MSKIEPPKFLADVYADLRDRHLLIPALALLVAILVVPVLLKSSEDAKSPPPPAATADASSVQPAVLASNQVGVRDYRKRLADLKSKNPFKQQFAPKLTQPTTGTTTPTTPTGTSTAVTPTTGAGGPPASLGGSNTAVLPPTSGSGDSGNGNGDSGNGNGDSNNTQVVHQLFTRRVDVKVGVQGDLKTRDGVKPMTILPDDDTPVLAFLGTDEDGKRAAFVVSSDVSAVSGVGTCVPSLADCLYVTLRKGEQVSLDYAPDGQTYDLKLVGIRDVKVKQ